MAENRTFVEPKTPSPAQTREGGGPTRPNPALTATIGRTVLPRVERHGEGIRLVHEDRHRYEPVGRLGQGGMGEVQRVRDHDIGREVAVKRLNPNLKNDGGLSRFVSEVRTVGALEHPNIVPIHDVGVDPDGNYFFVMKCVEGVTVEDILKGLRSADRVMTARFPLEQRMQIVRGVLQALEYAHARGVVHRDIKPANVMVGPFGEVVLMDWGIAKVVGGQRDVDMTAGGLGEVAGSATATRMGTMVGTPAYMSPEQFRGDLDRIDGRSDLYALGVMAYELLTLRNPASALPDVEAVKKLVLERDSVLEKGGARARADLTWFCDRATQRDPEKRYATAGAMLADLEAIERGLCRADCEVTTLKRATGLLGRFVDEHPALAMLSVLGAAVFLVLDVVALVAFAVT